MTVTEVLIKLRVEQPVASLHLGILRRAGMVNTEKGGRFIYYSLNYKRLEEIGVFAERLLDFKVAKKGTRSMVL
jgi:DNA-binding transcriptional ArsR family regulator